MQSVTQDTSLDLFNAIQTQPELATTKPDTPINSFLHKCLHPPSAVPGYIGLPTNDARSQVNIQWKNLELMRTPLIVDNATVRPMQPSELTTFNYGILCMNGARVLSVPFIFNSAVGYMVQDVGNIDIQDNYEFDNWHLDANLYRPAYRSITTYLNATAFNNTGAVTSCQFNPNVMFAGNILALSYENYDVFKKLVALFYRENRIKITPATISDRQAHEQWLRFPKYIREDILDTMCFTAEPHGYDLVDAEYVNLDPNTQVQIINLNAIGSNDYGNFPSASQLLTGSERAYAGKAFEGTFTVSRLNSISPAWLAASNTNADTKGLYECYSYNYDSLGASHLVAFRSPMHPGPMNTQPLLDTLWSKDMTWSYTLYEGLSLNTQTSVSTQLLIKKYYTGYEVQPAFKSAWSGMVTLGPRPDIRALQRLMDSFYDQKNTMPAKYNFLGTLLSAVGPHLLKAIPSIAQSLVTAFAPTEAKKEKEVVKKEIKKIAKKETKKEVKREEKPPRPPPYRPRIPPRVPRVVTLPPPIPPRVPLRRVRNTHASLNLAREPEVFMNMPRFNRLPVGQRAFTRSHAGRLRT